MVRRKRVRKCPLFIQDLRFLTFLHVAIVGTQSILQLVKGVVREKDL
jgi:hypothetical protein